MSTEAGKRASLRHGSAARRMCKCDPFYADIRQKGNFRCKALLPAGNLYLMLCRIVIILQPEMNGLSIGFHPIASRHIRHLMIKRCLLKRLSVTEDHPPAVQIGCHIRLIIFDEKPVMQNINAAKRIVTAKQSRIQTILPYPAISVLSRIFRSMRKPPVRTFCEICHDLRRFYHYLFFVKGLITDHAGRIHTSLRRPHAFPVSSAVDKYAGTGYSGLRRSLNRQKRSPGTAIIFIIRKRMFLIYMKLFVIYLLFLPKCK